MVPPPTIEPRYCDIPLAYTIHPATLLHDRLAIPSRSVVRPQHRPTAARCRDDHSVRVFASCQVRSPKYARALEDYGMSRQGAAPHVTRGRLDCTATHFEHARRGLVASLAKSRSDTSCEQKG